MYLSDSTRLAATAVAALALLVLPTTQVFHGGGQSETSLSRTPLQGNLPDDARPVHQSQVATHSSPRYRQPASDHGPIIFDNTQFVSQEEEEERTAAQRGTVDLSAWCVRLAAGVAIDEQEIAPGIFAWAEGKADDFVIHWRVSPAADPDQIGIVASGANLAVGNPAEEEPRDRKAIRVTVPTGTTAWTDPDQYGISRLRRNTRSNLSGKSWTHLQSRVIVPLTTFTVTNMGDNGGVDPAPGAGTGTLRQAIVDAKQDAGVPHIIAISVTGTINLEGKLPNITTPTAVNGPGAAQLTLRRGSGGQYRVLQVGGFSPTSFSGMTVMDGVAEGPGALGEGGGILAVSQITLNQCVISNNAADIEGGGVHVFHFAALDKGPSIFQDTVFTGNSAFAGGAIFALSHVNLVRCTVSNNSATVGAGVGINHPGNYLSTFLDTTFSGNTSGNQGGAINNQDSAIQLTNCTISGNTTQGNGFGTINNLGTISTTVCGLTNCTFAGNTSVVPSNGVAVCNGAEGSSTTTTYRNTIFSGTAPQIVAMSTAGASTVTSLGNNLCTDGSGNLTVAGDLPNTNPLLAALGMNGGPTQTHALLPGSPAINAGNTGASPIADQRGIARPQQGAADIGAFESRGFTISATGGTPQVAPALGIFANPLVVTITSPSAEPVNGGRVTFTVPGSGASCSIAGNPATVSGVTAMSGAVTANAVTGTYSVTVSANGATGLPVFTLTNTCPTITVTPASLPGGAAGMPYSQNLSATGTLGMRAFSVSVGMLPAGLMLNPTTGMLSGTPTATGTFNFTIRATDTNAGTNTCFGERPYTIAVACPTIAVGPTNLPAGTAAVAYSQTITATGTLGAPAFTVSAGTLPAGLTLNPTTGVLSGTPTVTGTFNFTIRATDTNPGTSVCFGERAYSLVLTCPTITVNPTTLPGGNAGSAYNQTVTASGGIVPYAFSISAGALPPGLTLTTGGMVSGIPTAAGTFNFTITATDANGCTGTRSYSVFLGGAELALLYVADTDNSRIQVFDGTNWSLAPRSSGVVGSAAGQFRSPEGVAATRTNQIYVADTGNNRIHWYNGFTWSDFATIGSALNQVRAPQAVAIDVTGQFLFVADTGNNRILRFNANAPNSAGVVLANSGGGSGQVNGPRGLAVDNLGNLFVADTGNSRILRIANATGVATADTGTVVTSALRVPEGVALDNEGNLYIADAGNSRILQLPGGVPGTPTALATLGTALGAVRSPEGVTVTNFAVGPLAGRQIIVGDTINNRIQARPLVGTTWSLVGGTGSGLGQFRSPSKIR